LQYAPATCAQKFENIFYHYWTVVFFKANLVPTALHNNDSSHGEIYSTQEEQTVYHVHYYLSPIYVQQTVKPSAAGLDCQMAPKHHNVTSFSGLPTCLLQKIIVSPSILKYEISTLGLLADTDYFCTDA
jgi:hypothetical protein